MVDSTVRNYRARLDEATLFEPPPGGGPPVELRYDPSLEGLRTLLLLAVVAAHSKDFLTPDASYPITGFGSLTMFFVLSGFLVAAIALKNYERTGSVEYGSYMWRRVQRLGAPLLLFAIVNFVVGWIQGSRMFTRPGGHTLGLVENTLTLLTFTNNLVPSFGYNQRLDSVQMWSLGVDMQVYLVLPLVIAVLLRWTRRIVPMLWIFGALIVVLQATRYLEFHHAYDARAYEASAVARIPVAAVYQRPENSFDAFLVGVLLCLLWKTRLLPLRLFRLLWAPALVLFVLGLLYMELISDAAYIYGYTLVILCSFVVVGDCLRPDSLLRRVFSTYLFRLLGRVSFTIYIWHLFVFLNVRRLLGESLTPFGVAVVAFISLGVVSTIAWWVAERPLLRLPPVGRPRLSLLGSGKRTTDG